jgi:hypothetical protein
MLNSLNGGQYDAFKLMCLMKFLWFSCKSTLLP